MTLIELEAQKALLIREILTDVNSEEMMHRLRDFLYKLKSETSSYSMPSDLLEDLMKQAEKDDAASLCITSEELDKEMETW